jgi:hypothetical protein
MRECDLCGSQLARVATGRQDVGARVIRIRPDRKEIYYQAKDSPPDRAPPYIGESISKSTTPRKLLMVVLVLSILLLPIMAYGLSIALSGNPPSGTPSGGFISVSKIENQTICAIFDEFQPVTRFSDCQFHISTGSWTSQDRLMLIDQTDFLYSPDANGYVEITFWDEEHDGIVNAGDYCIVHIPSSAVGTTISIHVEYEHTGSEICSSNLEF